MKIKKRISTSTSTKAIVPLVSNKASSIVKEEIELNPCKAHLPLGFIRVESDHATHYYMDHKYSPVYCFIQLYDSPSQSFIVTNQYGTDVLIHCTCLHGCLTPHPFINPKNKKEDEKLS